MITKYQMLGLLNSMKFDEDLIMGNPARQMRNDVLDKIIEIVNETKDINIEDMYRPRIIEDPDCPSGVCGSGGRI